MRNKKNVTKISSSAPAIIFNGILAMGTSFVDKGKEAITSTQERYNNVKELNKAAEEKMNESVKEYEKTFVILSNEIENLEKITDELRFSFKHLGIPITPSEYEIAKANQQAVNIENDLSAESFGNIRVKSSISGIRRRHSSFRRSRRNGWSSSSVWFIHRSRLGCRRLYNQ